ncbi:MAG: class I SAM-dependent methyltransferase [Arthrospira sp. SH-MAG29]|nr:class I SAM-dependent methyltransferase [Arthrospira sp. SH-MAG29]MBS0015517.1 class I SAM-dependent methyltransferase [Arthrospira sp. SH-MAG29]
MIEEKDKENVLEHDLKSESSLDFYLKNGFQKVEGWCNYRIFYFLKYISDVQKTLLINGGTCEIGVHHGKFFIGLHNLTTEGELSLAIDVFEDQHLNIDRSGKGSLEQFKTNISLFASRQESIQIMKKDSLALSIKDLLDMESNIGKFRLFSIDGGHTQQHTINDFKVAEQLVCNGGLVIVDDYLNQNWPGVGEGIARLFLLDSPRLAPFMIGASKLLFTTFSFHQEYFKLTADWVKSRSNQESFKIVSMYGYNVVSWIPTK